MRMYEEALQSAFDTGNFEEALYHIRQDPTLADYRLPKTRADTLLLAACIHERPDVAQELLTIGAEPFFNCQSMNGRNVFNVCHTIKQDIVLNIILSHTSHWQEPESVQAWNTAFEKTIETAFHTQEFKPALRLLRYRPQLINHTTITGISLLSVAHKHERLDLVSKLLDMGADPYCGYSDPFMYFETQKHQEIANIMLERTGATQAGEHWDYFSQLVV